MGLAITRAILLAHGGEIEAASGPGMLNAPGRGASFRFWVPLVEKEPAADWAKVQAKAASL
jgi:signal transduction histidine kinase